MFIHSVDAQSSANGGIIIQVIGEMSNNSEAWRKFAQTFFLAEQPNGYFVLNDIFRYLKEESVDVDEAEDSTVEIATYVELAAVIGGQDDLGVRSIVAYVDCGLVEHGAGRIKHRAADSALCR